MTAITSSSSKGSSGPNPSAEFLSPVAKRQLGRSRAINVEGFISPPVNFKPWKTFSDAPRYFRPGRPVRTLTVRLQELYDRVQSKDRTILPPEKTFSPTARNPRWDYVKPCQCLGSGSNGKVYLLQDRLTGRAVAGKLNIPENKNVIPQSSWKVACEERENLYRLQAFPHVIGFYGGVSWRDQWRKMLIMELASCTLDKILKAKQLSFIEQISVLYQLLNFHWAASAKKWVHGDLKPSNIGFDHRGYIKLLDVSFAHDTEQYDFGPNKIQALWERAPEIILGRKYDTSIDLWSIGCIACEMFLGKTFVYGVNDDNDGRLEALGQIANKIGLPSREYLQRCSLKNTYFRPNGTPHLYSGAPLSDNWLERVRQKAQQHNIPKVAAELFVELLAGMLKYEQRITPPAALELCKQIGSVLETSSQ